MADATSSVVEQTNIPSYARPYVEEMLGAAAGQVFQYATDAQGNVQTDAEGRPVITGFQPQQSYGGERFAQFTPLQLQAFQAAQGLGPSANLQDATSMAKQAGLGALGHSYTPFSFTADNVASDAFNAERAQQYMSPYMQGVVDVQQIIDRRCK